MAGRARERRLILVREAVLDALVGGLVELGVPDAEVVAGRLAEAVCGRLAALDLVAATQRSVARAREDRQLTERDEAAVAALLQLARRIDLADRYFEDLAELHAERNLRPPSQDNVSLPTFLKYCEALGLTPSGRKQESKPKGAPGGGGLAARRSAELSRQSAARRSRQA